MGGGICCWWLGSSINTGEARSTGGRGAQGDFAGVDNAGALATKVGFSGAPLRTKLLPEAMRLGLTDGEALALSVATPGTGDLGCSLSGAGMVEGGTGTFAMGAAGVGTAGANEGVGWFSKVILVPSVHVIASGAHSSSSSSSAQFDCPRSSSGRKRSAMWIPYFFNSSSEYFFGSSGTGADDCQ